MRQSQRNWNWERGSVPPGHWKRDGVHASDREREVRMVSRFRARCDHCSEVIGEGSDLLWHPERKYRIHLRCTGFFDRWAQESGDALTGLPTDWNKVTVRKAPSRGEPGADPSQTEQTRSAATPADHLPRTSWTEREVAKKRRYPRSGQPWSLEEEDLLRERYRTDQDLDLLAEQHQRTPLGIQARLVKIGLMDS